MKTSDFNYHLPEKLIANYPLDNRSSSRLLVSSPKMEHLLFKEIIKFFEEGDLLVVNNTSVIPARIFGNKESGGSIEVMLERVLDGNKALVQIRSGRSPKIGSNIILNFITMEKPGLKKYANENIFLNSMFGFLELSILREVDSPPPIC